MIKTSDVLVIGGGLHGLSAALQLARDGARVRLVERETVGRHASGVNAGGVRRLGRHVAELPLSEKALAMWREMPELVGDDCGFTPSGQIKIAESEADLELLKARAEEVRGLGYEHEEIIDQAALRELIPAVAEHCAGAMIVRGDGFADPYRTCIAFRRAAVAAGVEIDEGVAVEALEREGDIWRARTSAGDYQAPEVVNCAGAWGAVLAGQLGEPVPVRAAAYMMMVTQAVPRFVEPVVGLASRKLSLKQMANGTVVIGGGFEGKPDVATGKTALDVQGLAKSAEITCTIFPILRGACLVRAWAGIDGEAADKIPVIGRSLVHEGLTHAFGFSGHGFQLMPAVGRALADLIRTGQPGLPLLPFSPGRFDKLLKE
ncbi:MAG: FAD-binding oxidoreductase [Alphaproteobacteria bacterium]|jgi:sarcosine oxidase subunit beta|nr:FAD-binding oxidoreductase [Alphaproteobacteria bacterium]